MILERISIIFLSLSGIFLTYKLAVCNNTLKEKIEENKKLIIEINNLTEKQKYEKQKCKNDKFEIKWETKKDILSSTSSQSSKDTSVTIPEKEGVYEIQIP